MGWVGYHGVRAHHFHEQEPGSSRRSTREPMGAILSLCCRTASRKRVGLSYAESLPLMGVAAASFGAVGDTLHSDNTRWAVGVCSALAAGASTVGDLLVRAAPASPTALQSYRLIGDPLAPLGTNERSLRRAQRVRTYAWMPITTQSSALPSGRELRSIRRDKLPPAWDDDSHFRDVLGLDSLDLVEMVARLEQATGMFVPDEDVAQLMSISATVDYVRARQPALPATVRSAPQDDEASPEPSVRRPPAHCRHRRRRGHTARPHSECYVATCAEWRERGTRLGRSDRGGPSRGAGLSHRGLRCTRCASWTHAGHCRRS